MWRGRNYRQFFAEQRLTPSIAQPSCHESARNFSEVLTNQAGEGARMRVGSFTAIILGLVGAAHPADAWS